MKPRSLKETEARIKKTIMDWLGEEGYLAWRNNSGTAKGWSGNFMQLSPTGSPDIYYVRKGAGRLVGLEVKKAHPKTYLSKEQKEYRDKLLQAGAEYYVVRSLDDAKEAVINGNGKQS